jgi:hypothetical protein
MIDDAEPATVYHTRIVMHAQRPHQCDECQRQIKASERYRSTTMLCDGFWSTFKTCAHCMQCEAWLQAQCGGYLHGGVQLDLEGHLDELEFGPGERVALLRLVAGMRRQWRSFADPSRLLPARLAFA